MRVSLRVCVNACACTRACELIVLYNNSTVYIYYVKYTTYYFISVLDPLCLRHNCEVDPIVH